MSGELPVFGLIESGSQFSEDDLLPISGLQHLAYCPRQFALIHIEQVWAENRFTAEGQLLHRKVDEAKAESRGDLHIARSLRLRSFRLGLSGIADVVEFHRGLEGISLSGKSGLWQPYPVEYKRGKPKHNNVDDVQLCAQALCLEEMLGAHVTTGALFYGKTKRRREVVFSGQLRQATAELATAMHQLWNSGVTPIAELGGKCEQCSLLSLCMPQARSGDQTKGYIESLFKEE